MSKEICISSTPHETRLAILEDDQLAEIYYERENEYTLAGSIYKGRVTRVLPGMQSAFVEVGLERDAFLYVTDFLEEQGDSADFEKVSTGSSRREAAPEQTAERGTDRISDQGSDSEPAEPGESRSASDPGREQGQQRSRGRGRNRGRGGDQRIQSPRPESQPAPSAVSRPLPVEPFDSASFAPPTYSSAEPETGSAGLSSTAPASTVPTSAGSSGGSAAPRDGGASEDEFQEGTRRWRGRRGRRGGSRSRDPREATRQSAPAPGPVTSFAESEPLPERVPSINAVHAPAAHAQAAPIQATHSTASHTPAFHTPIVLPGESLSKYSPASGQNGGSKALTAPAPAGREETTRPATVTARPSTLVEAPLAWDGSGPLPGETISRYRQPEDAPSAAPVNFATEASFVEQPAESSFEAGSDEETGSNFATGLDRPEQPQSAIPEHHFAEHSAFETAYEAQEQHVSDHALPEHEALTGTGTSGQQYSEELTEDDVPEGEITEEVTEFDPEEASASHRIDPSAPSEFRVAAPVEEEEELEEATSVQEEEVEEEDTFFVEEAGVPESFHSVAPEEALSQDPAQHTEHQELSYPHRPDHSHVVAEVATESVQSYPVPVHEPQPPTEEIRTPHAVTAQTEPQSSESSVSNPEHKEEAHHESKPVVESFWQAVKGLVTGHSPAREEARQEHQAPLSTTIPAIEGAAEDTPEQSLAMRYEETQESDAAHQNAASHAHPESASDESDSHRHIFHSEARPVGGTPGFASDVEEDEGEDEEGSSQGFAPGSGLIEEETIDDEEYDYEPMHAHGDEHDLEDLEEETLQNQAGIEIGEVVREAHLEQRVKNNPDHTLELENGYDDASGGFTEEDFEEPGISEEEGDEEEEPVAGQIAGPARVDSGNGGRNGERSGEPRPSDRGRDGRDRSRGRGGRRPGNGHSGGNRRQNTQAADLPIISELLKQGQEILVQIAKEPIAKKGARITSHIALPGRFLVFMPTVNHVGVSRKISSDEERQRLKRILISEKGTAAGGFIVRTAADGAGEEDLRADIRFLLALWNEIKQRSDEAKAPALIYHDLNLIERVLRDQVSDNFSAIWVDSETEYERIVRFLQRFQPSLVRRVKLYTKETPLFEQFGIQEEISKALKSKVWLKSGGSIVINQTEALVAIDINTGKFVGKTARLEDTILRTNLDAIPEIVRQIRLRDLGGIIVIDFIDMDERKNRNRVMQALEDELKHDRAPSKVLQFNDFGLVAITRKRVKQSLERTLSVQCEVCTGTGMVKSPTTVCNEIYTEMRKMHRTLERKDVMLRVHPEVVKSLKSTNGRWLNELEEMTGKTIIVKSDPALHPEQFDIH